MAELNQQRLIDYLSAPGVDGAPLLDALLGLGLADADQGGKADTALQPSNIGTTIASAAQGGKADTALQPASPDSALTFLQAGTDAANRVTRNKNRDVINVLDFGATGSGTTDDSVPIQAAIDHLRSLGGNNRPGLVFGNEGGAKHNFLISNSIDLTAFHDAIGPKIDLGGCVLLAATNGKPVFDMLDSQHVEICNGGIFGVGANSPSYGVQMGRASGTISNPLLNGRAYNTFRNVSFTGTFTGACLINSASEICVFDKCNFWNSATVAGSATVILDGRRAVHLTSDFVTVTQPNDVASSFNDNLFLNCTFEKIGGENPATGNAIKIYGPLRSPRFVNCYAQNEFGAAVFTSGDLISPHFDIHCEAGNIKNNFLIDTSIATTLWREGFVREYNMFCVDALIAGTGGAGNVFWADCEIVVPVASSAKPMFKKNGAVFYFHGKLSLGQSPSNALYDLSMLDRLNGDVFTVSQASNVVVAPIGAYRISDFNSLEQRYRGIQRFIGGVAFEAGVGLAVAAGVLTIPRDGNVFPVTSGGNISKLSVDATNDKGRRVILIFGYTGTLTNQLTPGNTLLSSNFSFVTNNLIELWCDGIKWVEIARSANVIA